MRKLVLSAIAVVLAIGLYRMVHRSGQHKLVDSGSSGNDSNMAPVLTLNDLNGNFIRTFEAGDRVVVVNFWAAWCTPCAEEVPAFISLQKRYQSQGLRIIGISVDDSDSDLRNFYRTRAMNYPVIAGDKEIAEAYGGILGLPTTFIVGPRRQIVKKLTGSTDFAALESTVVKLLDRGL